MTIIKPSTAFKAGADWVSGEVRDYMKTQAPFAVDTVQDVRDNDFEQTWFLFVKAAGAFYRLDLSSTEADDGDTVIRDNIGRRYIKTVGTTVGPWDVQVADLAARAAYDNEAEGFVVLVDDVGDGRAAFYTMGSGGAADWLGPAYLTGLPGAAGAPGSSDVVGTSTSSVAISVGSKIFTVAEADRGWGLGARLRISSDANPAVNWMEGVIIDYVDPTLTVLIDLVGGSGSHADWTINLAGEPGEDGGIQPTDTDASGFGFVIDEDDMASDSATKVPTQQSVKAYVDAGLAAAPLLATENEFLDTNVFTLTAGQAGARVEITKHSSPANYSTTRASLILQHREDFGGADVPNGTKLESVLFVFTDEAQGVTTSSTNSSVITGQGIRSFASKENDGSTHAFTASGELRENGVDNAKAGANGYNELGGFQALLTNVGSSNGYISAFEGHVRDSPDDGANDYATRLTGLAAGIAKYNASTLAAYNLHVLNEGGAGSQHLDAILYPETRGNGAWKRGIDLYGAGDWDFSTLVAMQMKRTNKIRWTNGTLHSEIYANGSGHLLLAPNAGAAVYLGNDGTLAAPTLAFASDPNTGIFRNAADDIQIVAGGVAGVRVLNNNLQVATAGGALKTVTEGAVDSGGAGFKVLRVPN